MLIILIDNYNSYVYKHYIGGYVWFQNEAMFHLLSIFRSYYLSWPGQNLARRILSLIGIHVIIV